MYWEGIDCGEANIPATILGSSPSKAGSGKVCSLRDCRLCEAVINVVVTNANAKAGKQCYAIFPGYKNAVLSIQREVQLPTSGREPSSRKVTDFQFLPSWLYSNKKETPARGISFGVNLLDLNGTYLLPVGDAIEAGTGYRVSFSILCNVNGEYLVA